MQKMPDLITFVSESPQAHGVADRPDLHGRDVCVLVRSVGMNEAYQAMANGLNPSLVFELRDAADYNGEKILEYHGDQMRVVRTYQTGRGIELTCEKIGIDAAILEGGIDDA